MSANEIRNFIFENYYKRIVFSKESSYSMKHLKKKKRFIVACKNKSIEKVPNCCNAKEHYKSFLRKKKENQ